MICPPLGWEGIQVYQSMQLVANTLAAAGFHVFRLHYDGTGESLGSDDEPGRVEAWLESIRRAVTTMRGLTGVRAVGLVGMRIGATMAGKIASEVPVASLVLWEPCVSGAHYGREMEILASAAPRAIQSRDIEGPKGVEAGGYLLTPETLADLATIDLQKLTPKDKPDVLVISRSDRPPAFAKKLVEHLTKEGCATLHEQIAGFKEMMTYPERAVPATAHFERIRDWALERSKTIEGAVTPPALAEEAVEGKARRRPIQFGPDSRLFGVLTEPVDGNTKRPVLFLTGGVVPRIGVNRMYVEIANQLAARGHTVLRMDVSGICESKPAEGNAPNDPHAPSLLGDVATAVELLLAKTGEKSITLMGLCSGAYASYQTALADPRVRSITLLNPEVFHLAAGGAKFSATEQSEMGKHYLKSLTSPAAWKKLLSGKANVRYIAGFVGAKAKSTIEKTREKAMARIKKVPQGVPGEMHKLLSNDVKIAIVMAENDPGYDPLMATLGADKAMLEGMGLKLKVTPGPDHTFNDFSTRIPLVGWLVDTLSQ